MPDFSQEINPFAEPIEAHAAPVMAPLPGGLKAVCIIAIVLGGLGTLLALKDFATLAIGQKGFPQFGMQDQAGDEQAAQLQKEMMAKSAEVQKEMAAFLWPAAVAHLVTGLLLVVGGIMALQGKSTGRRILLFGCGLAVLYEVGQVVLSTAVWLRLAPVFSNFVKDSFARGAQGDGPVEVPGWMDSAVTLLPIVVIAIPFLIKFVFYIASLFYLRRSRVIASFR